MNNKIFFEMLHQLNSNNKKSFLRILLEIVNADKLVKMEEFEYVEKIQDILGISDHELEESQHLNAIECLVEIRSFSEEKKSEIVNILYEIIISDKDINENEVKTFQVICDGADLSITENISKKLGICK